MAKYFNDNEFACSCCGQLPAEGMSKELENLLDDIRTYLGQITLTSAYRCPEHNEEVGGVPNSEHVKGTAADIDASIYGVDIIADLAESLGADGVGRYYDSCFVHVDCRSGRIGANFRW